MKIRFVIPTIPVRFANAINLRDQLVSYGFETKIMLDTLCRGLWWNAKQCWSAADLQYDWHLLIQDDVELCPGFDKQIVKALEVVPGKIVQFFSGGSFKEKTINEIIESGDHWYKTYGVTTCQLVAMKPSTALSFYLFAAKLNFEDKKPNDDEMIKLFCIMNDIYIWVATPELVEHLGLKSSYKNAYSITWKSRCFLDTDCEIDWTKGIDEPRLVQCTKPWYMWQKAVAGTPFQAEYNYRRLNKFAVMKHDS